MPSLAYLARWWLAAEAIGLFTMPIAFLLFRRLPDRGYGFARAFGLLVITYALWLGATAGILPFSTGSAVLAVLALAVTGGALFVRHQAAITAWLRESQRYVLWSEAVFLGAFLIVALLHSYQPQIENTEKPFEYANYTAVGRSATFPPTDPWFSGKPMAYYYMGYVTANSVARLTATPPEYGFNIALILTAGVAAAAIFGLAANLSVLLRKGTDLRGAWPLAAGLMAVVFLLVIGNLEGIFEFGAAHGWNPSWVYDNLGVNGLQARASAHWYPDEPGFGSWWRATRLGSDWNFLEFPFFSFLLGDLHPHVLALPFKLLAAGFGLALLTATALPRPGNWREGLPLFVAAALAAGALIAIHPWDYPVFAVLCVLVIVARARMRQGAQAWRSVAVTSAAFVGLSLLFYAPFFVAARGSIVGIAPTEVFFRDARTVNAEGMYLPFQHFLLFWTPLMLPTAIFVGYCLAERGWIGLWRYGVNALWLVAVLPFAWAVAVFGRHGLSGLGDELGVRGEGWLAVLVLGLLLAATLAALWEEIVDRDPADGLPGRVFLLAAAAVSLLLVYGPELFMVQDSSGTRANTTFKLWYSAWTLLSAVGATGGLYALCQVRWRGVSARALRPVALGLSAAVLAGALVYPAYASFNRTNGFTGQQTLDGLAFLQSSNHDEFAAAAWLNANVPGVTPVLEAVGGSYSPEGRIASRTGLPTVAEWYFHQQQQRTTAILPAYQSREQDVNLIYTSTDVRESLTLLARYRVRYIVVGKLERDTYGTAGLAKFAEIGTPVFTSPSVTIYRTEPAPLYAGVP